MKKLPFLFLLLALLTLTGCSALFNGNQVIQGSGNVTSEQRRPSGFSSISLEGSADVQIVFGASEGLTIQAEDNILPAIETVVQNRQLIIRTKRFTTITTSKPVQVQVTMKTLDSIKLSGSGTITVPELSGDQLTVSLPGSGTITVKGTANQVNITLPGSGNIYCDNLKTKTATVKMDGTGNITVYASEVLNASINGSGNIRFSGSPAKVNKSIRGSGTINE